MERDARYRFIEEVIEPLSRCLTPEVARRVVELRAAESTQARVRELAERCNDGLLTPDERQEYETFVMAGNMIAILQAKARRLLSGQSAA